MQEIALQAIEGASGAIHPRLGPEDIKTVSLFISGAMEGTTMFSGFDKPWDALMPQIKAIALKSLVDLAKTITPEDIGSVVPRVA